MGMMAATRMTINDKNDRGGILLNVLLMSVLMSIMMAAILVSLDAPERFYTSELEQTQAYYNAKAGILIGEKYLNTFINDPHTTVSDVFVSSNYPSVGTNGKAPWYITFMLPNSFVQPAHGVTVTYYIYVNSIGYDGSASSTLSAPVPISVTG